MHESCWARDYSILDMNSTLGQDSWLGRTPAMVNMNLWHFNKELRLFLFLSWLTGLPEVTIRKLKLPLAWLRTKCYLKSINRGHVEVTISLGDIFSEVILNCQDNNQKINRLLKSSSGRLYDMGVPRPV